MTKVTALVPAYNEEHRISSVLGVLESSRDIIDEIVVINDGSTDGTAHIVSGNFPGVLLINLERNMGKGAALLRGIDQNDSDIYLFVDADLIGFKRKHVEELVQPLLNDGEVQMTVGRFVNGRIRTDLSQLLAGFLTGQRAIRKEFLKSVPDLSDTKFGFETALTRYAKDNEVKVVQVLMPDASHVMKEEKLGFFRGFSYRMVMYWHIARSFLKHRSRLKS